MLRVERNLSVNTLECYQRDIKQYLKFILNQKNINDVGEINQTHVRRFIRSQDAKGFAASTMARICSSIRSYHNFLMAENFVDDNPAQFLITPRNVKKLPNFLSEKEISKIIKAIDETNQFSKEIKQL